MIVVIGCGTGVVGVGGIVFELVDKSSKVIRDIEFLNDISYKIREGQQPFAYVLCHCSSTSNGAYSNPMWVYYENGETGEVKDLPVTFIEQDGKQYIFKKGMPYPNL